MSLLAQNQQLKRRVGGLTLLLVALATAFFVFINPQIEWRTPMRVRVYFASTGGLTEGAPFIVAGRPIGRIESIALSPRGAKTPLGGEEGVAVTIKLERKAARHVVKGGDVFVTSHGILSTRFLEIGPPPGPGPTLTDGDELRGIDPPSLDRVLQRTLANLDIARRFADDVRPEANALRVEIDKLQAMLLELAPQIMFRDDFRQLTDEAKRTYALLGGDPGIDRMRATRDETTSTIGLARESLASLRKSADMLSASLDVLKARLGGKGALAIARAEAAIAGIKAAIAKVDPLLASVDAIQQRIDRGEGTLLKLSRDPEFPEDAKALGKILKRHPWRVLIHRPGG